MQSSILGRVCSSLIPGELKLEEQVLESRSALRRPEGRDLSGLDAP